jgi:hypothetical protein
MSHPTKAMLAGKSPLIGISIPLIDEFSDFSLLRPASATPSVCGDRHKTVINPDKAGWGGRGGDRQCNFDAACF